jgi:hypothetical protein
MITTCIKLGASAATGDPLSASSDDALIARVAAGDKLAMHTLFAGTAPPSIAGSLALSETEPRPKTF